MFQACEMDEAYAATTFTHVEQRVTDGVRIVPAESAEYGCLIANSIFFFFNLCRSVIACVKAIPLHFIFEIFRHQWRYTPDVITNEVERNFTIM